MGLVEALYGLFLAGAVYGGIRADIRAIHRSIAADQTRLLAIENRLDNHIDRGPRNEPR